MPRLPEPVGVVCVGVTPLQLDFDLTESNFLSPAMSDATRILNSIGQDDPKAANDFSDCLWGAPSAGCEQDGGEAGWSHVAAHRARA